MSRRIFHISNRVEIPEPGKGNSGGLDEAIAEAPEGYEIVRFGWSGRVIEDNAYNADAAIQVIKRDNITYVVTDLKESDFKGYYEGISNAYLWPLFHYRTDISEAGFNKNQVAVYNRVNALFAEIASRYIQEDDIVMVHDYHLIPLGSKLKISNPLGFFLHTPAPSADLLEELNRSEQTFIYDLLDKFSAYDFVGLQSKRDFVNLRSILGQHSGISTPNHFETQTFRKIADEAGRKTQFGVFPVAGNNLKYKKLAEEWVHRKEVDEFLNNNTGGIIDGMSVDRLDYAKGLVNKAWAVGRWLREYGHNGEAKIHFTQIAPFGREGVAAFREERIKVELAFDGIREIFGDVVCLHMAKVERPLHLGLARRSKFGLVTPLRDGMNLYAGEFQAAQDPADPAVLILSKFAGAAEIYEDCAIEVDPRQPRELARAIQLVRKMSVAERQERHATSIKLQGYFTNQRWQTNLVQATKDAAIPRLAA